MASDEILAAIDRAEGKRRDLELAQPEAKVSLKLLERLPSAAQLYRKQIMQGLGGDRWPTGHTHSRRASSCESLSTGK